MLYQPSNISPDEIYNTGTVDITQGIIISWRVSGDSAMTAYQIDFFQNDAASTALYSTGKVTLSSPFWGVNYAGATQYYSVTIDAATLSGAGMTNGNEYKFLITQWWGASDSVQQFTASLFLTRATPTLTLGTISGDTVTSKDYSFTATYSQAQGDAISWVEWELADVSTATGSTVRTTFYDSGPIYGTGELQMDYDGFLNGNTYSVQCTVETENGMQVTTGWQDFDVSYELETAAGGATACQIAGDACTWITWDRDVAADGYSIMRQMVGGTRLSKIADVDATVGQIRDYSARSGQSYIYYVFPTSETDSGFLTEPKVSNTVSVQYWGWAIVEAQQTAPNEFSVIRSYIFKYGSGGVSEGAFSNNNNPQISANFTRYPTRQGTTANYLTGSVSGYIGTISAGKTYSDTVSQSEAIFALSNTTNALFLHDPKGRFLRIHTAGAMSLSVDHKKAVMPQTLTVSWVEVGPTENVHVILYPGGDFYPADKIIYTTVEINPKTGALMWNVPDDYAGETSTLSLSGGILYADPEGPFTPATLSINEDRELIAEIGE